MQTEIGWENPKLTLFRIIDCIDPVWHIVSFEARYQTNVNRSDCSPTKTGCSSSGREESYRYDRLKIVAIEVSWLNNLTITRLSAHQMSCAQTLTLRRLKGCELIKSASWSIRQPTDWIHGWGRSNVSGNFTFLIDFPNAIYEYTAHSS